MWPRRCQRQAHRPSVAPVTRTSHGQFTPARELVTDVRVRRKPLCNKAIVNVIDASIWRGPLCSE